MRLKRLNKELNTSDNINKNKETGKLKVDLFIKNVKNNSNNKDTSDAKELENTIKYDTTNLAFNPSTIEECSIIEEVDNNSSNTYNEDNTSLNNSSDSNTNIIDVNMRKTSYSDSLEDFKAHESEIKNDFINNNINKVLKIVTEPIINNPSFCKAILTSDSNNKGVIQINNNKKLLFNEILDCYYDPEAKEYYSKNI